eukprot:1196060-Prorocentrum_minimum.AAC.3
MQQELSHRVAGRTAAAAAAGSRGAEGATSGGGKVATRGASAAGRSKGEGAEGAGLCPMVWVCKWVDYSCKYGIGYQLSNGCCGVVFNDGSKLIQEGGGSARAEYRERHSAGGDLEVQTLDLAKPAPPHLKKKHRNLKKKVRLCTEDAVSLNIYGGVSYHRPAVMSSYILHGSSPSVPESVRAQQKGAPRGRAAARCPSRLTDPPLYAAGGHHWSLPQLSGEERRLRAAGAGAAAGTGAAARRPGGPGVCQEVAQDTARHHLPPLQQDHPGANPPLPKSVRQDSDPRSFDQCRAHDVEVLVDLVSRVARMMLRCWLIWSHGWRA